MFKVIVCNTEGEPVKGVEVKLVSYDNAPLWESKIRDTFMLVSDDEGVIEFPDLKKGMKYRLDITGVYHDRDVKVVHDKFNKYVRYFSYDDAVAGDYVSGLRLNEIVSFDFRSNFGRKHLSFIYEWGNDKDEIETALLVGSVRSGKTVAACLRFLFHILSHPEMPKFLMTAQTYGSLVDNVVKPFLSICHRFGVDVTFLKGAQVLEFKVNDNVQTVVLAGLNDISSEERIKGLTVGGWLCDEVVICNDEAVKQGISRCSLAGSKIIWTTNANKPSGYVYDDYIYNGGSVSDCMVFNFNMLDNIHVSLNYILKQFDSYSPSSIYFRRNLLNEWIGADGLIYEVFDRSKHVRDYSREEVQELLGKADALVVGCDYGQVTVFGVGVHIYDEVSDSYSYVLLDESYHDGTGDNSGETDTHRVKRLKDLIGKYRKGFGGNVFVNLPHDSSANLFNACKDDPFFKGVRVDLFKPETNDEIERINDLFFNDCLHISKGCVKTIEQVSKYQWDSKALKRGVDKPKKLDDHCCDMLRGVVRPCCDGVGMAQFGLVYW